MWAIPRSGTELEVSHTLPLGPFLLAGLQLWGCWAMPLTTCLTIASLGAEKTSAYAASFTFHPHCIHSLPALPPTSHILISSL